MKFLSTIREFSSIIFNKPTGDDIEIKPASKAYDTDAEIVYNLPDGGTPNLTNVNDTLALLAETQTFSSKSFSDKVEIFGTGSGSYTISPQDSDGNKTLLLPNIPTNNDEFTLNSQTQTLSNKTLVDPKIEDPTLGNDYIFDTSAIVADRTVTLPLLSGNDTFVFEDHNQTLENKTIVATANNISAISNANIAASGTANIALNKLAATTANVALKTDASGYLVPSTVSDTELEQLAGNTFGGSTAGDVVTIDGTQTLSGKTISELRYNEADVTRATSMAKPSATIIHITGTAGNIETLTGGADGDTRILVNETGGTVSLVETAAVGSFHTTGSDVDILDNGAVQLVYEAAEDKWRIIGGAGGAGGGLTLSAISAGLTASANVHYLTSAGPYNINLPAGSAGDIIRFSDTDSTWHTGNITLIPDGAETIDGQTSFILDVQDSWFQIMWDGSQWVSDDSLDPSTVDLTGDITTSNTVKADQGFLTKDSATLDYTVESGCTLQHPFLTVEAGVTYTNNGSMVVAGDLVVTGTLIDNGTVYNN